MGGLTLRYPGGKNGYGVYQKIINLIPPHDTYIEAFLGSGAILKRKRPAKRNIGIDVDMQSVRAFQKLGTNAVILCQDALSFLRGIKSSLRETDFIYCDPPYLLETRSCKRPLYKHEFGSESDHRRLLECLLQLPCRIMISGYDSPLYSDLIGSWNIYRYEVRNRKGTVAHETIWMNYERPLTLHDYSYLGDDFRQRDAIKRKALRWRTTFERLDILERQAILSAINQAYC